MYFSLFDGLWLVILLTTIWLMVWVVRRMVWSWSVTALDDPPEPAPAAPPRPGRACPCGTSLRARAGAKYCPTCGKELP